LKPSTGLAAACALALGLLWSPARAERLITTIAPSKISISASYSGGHIFVFGAITDIKTPRLSYDAIATVIGPRQDLVVRLKERVLGIWVNRSSKTFIGVPSYLAVSANRPFESIAPLQMLRDKRVGLSYNVLLDQSVDKNDPFQTNFIDARIQEGLFVVQPNGVSFISPTVFRADIPLSNTVLTGAYQVFVQIFADGQPIAEAPSTFQVEKIGLPQFVVASSVNYSLIYGLATMAMALLTGWIASVAFSRN